MNQVNKSFSEYNGIIKENDKIYRSAARSLGLSDSAFWILYALRETEKEVTQRELINANYFPPQTVNSALKKMEKEGYVELCSAEDRRSKKVCLTQKGRELAEHTVDKVILLEIKTVEGLTEEERALFLKLFHKYTNLLNDNLSMLQKENV